MAVATISREAAATLPDSLRFAKYVRAAAERGACAITLTGDDFEQLAGMIAEAHAALSAGALDMSDLDAWQQQATQRAADPGDVLARLDDALQRIGKLEQPEHTPECLFAPCTCSSDAT